MGMSFAPNATVADTSSEATRERTRRWLIIWLAAVALLLVGMIVLGGATRLTQSGLSITEWRPVTGIVPPLSEAEWQAEFEKYQRIPQYTLLFPDMTLSGFKTIYWWEWSHRMLGRLIGVAILIPLIVFAALRRVGPRLMRRLVFIVLLVAGQGALGWYMVQSGFTEGIAVSPYRLAAHLGLAFIIYGAVLGTIFDLVFAHAAPRPQRAGLYSLLFGFAVLVFLQILMGAFMAGTHAGLTYNTWPLMAGRLVPEGLFTLEPWTRNLFENVTTVQFIHRTLAYVILIAAAALWLRLRGRSASPMMTLAAKALLAAVCAQIALGIATLLAVVPLWLALLHQLGAIAIFSAALFLLKTALIPAQASASA